MPRRSCLFFAMLAVTACSNVSTPDRATMLSETDAPTTGGALADFGKNYCMTPPKDPSAKWRWMDDCISDGINT